MDFLGGSEPFQAAVDLEENERLRGYRSGLKVGAAEAAGAAEGAHLGHHRGAALGYQIGNVTTFQPIYRLC